MMEQMEQMELLTVLLVDDHALMRAGIKALIDRMPHCAVTAEASNIAEALECLDEAVPDVALIDISMGTENGLDLLQLLKQRAPGVAVLILSMHAAEEIVAEALGLGAGGYLLKDAAPVELELALAALRRNESYLSSAVAMKMVRWFVRPKQEAQLELQLLTARQIQILGLIAEGKSTKQIAFQLTLSDKTVAAHRGQIMERLSIRDRAGLVAFAAQHGLPAGAANGSARAPADAAPLRRRQREESQSHTLLVSPLPGDFS